MNSKKIFILPVDGYANGATCVSTVQSLFTEPDFPGFISHIKLNDALHNTDVGGPVLNKTISGLVAEQETKMFLDFKIFDVSATMVNYLKKYLDCPPDILTVSSQCGIKGILELRRLLPATKLAMVSVPTDISDDECNDRFGQAPAVKIYNDLQNLRRSYQKKAKPEDNLEPFDLVVCSAYELPFLKKNLPANYKFIVPAIRDEWMRNPNEHQERKVGVLEAMNLGADFIVMGAQLTKGNPSMNISPAKSRELTMAEVNKFYNPKLAISFDSSDTLESKTPLMVLESCHGYYKSSALEEGKRLVAYAGTYDAYDGAAVQHVPMIKNFVGFEYFNFAKAEEDPDILDYFGKMVADQIKAAGVKCDVVVGAPMGGICLATAVGRHLHCRHIFAEKKTISLANESGGKEKSKLVISRHDIRPGDNVILIEDVCNNFSTTEKLQAEIIGQNGVLNMIACAFNRSGKHEWNSIPVAESYFIPTEQYKQEDPLVADLIAAGKISWNPKPEWGALMAWRSSFPK
ncbi:MAG: orotidine 5'-phosphate decarboxylase / HUMPS family protein [Patescibacteria group bacterium]